MGREASIPKQRPSEAISSAKEFVCAYRLSPLDRSRSFPGRGWR